MDSAVKRTKAWEYSEEVLAETENVRFCGWIKKAASRFQEDLKRGDLIYDLNQVELLSIFFEEIVYIPELLEPRPLPLPAAFWWEQFYAFKMKDNGRRRFKDLLLELARKNAKTFYCGALSIYDLLFGEDKRPVIIHAANSREQALECTKLAGEIIEISPELKNLIDTEIFIRRWNKEASIIKYRDGERRGEIKAISKKPRDGGNTSDLIFDELHETLDMSLIQSQKTGQIKRLNPSRKFISSPGSNMESPLYSVYREHAIKVLNKVVIDDRYLPFLYEQDNKEDWNKPELMEKANPMAPYFPGFIDNWIDDMKDAEAKGGSVLVSFQIKNCGIWTNSADTWIQDEIVRANHHGISEDELIGKPCYMGIDLSKGKDLTVFLYLFPDIRPGIHAVKAVTHIPEEKIKNNEDKVDYLAWDKWLVVHPGNVLEHDVLANHTLRDMENYDIQGIGYDVKMAYHGVLNTIAKSGYAELCTAIQQGYSGLGVAVSECFDLIKSKRFDFLNNPVLFWCFSNVVMKVGDMGDQHPSRKESKNKIDIVSAMLTAWAKRNMDKSEPAHEPGIIGIQW